MLRSIISTILEALFPLSGPEKELALLTPIKALNVLPASPPVPISDASAIFAYKDPRVQKLIWHIKYKRSKHAVEIAGYALYKWLKEVAVNDSGNYSYLIIPMPITPRRQRERGYNQCELILEEIQRLNDESPTNRFTSFSDLLIRTNHFARQTLKNRSERLESVKDIFSVNEQVAKLFKPTLIDNSQGDNISARNKKIIVIDDVITTGSTMKEALNTLRSAGFQNVYGLSVAH